jgi:pilus assembly protein FimV
VDLGAPSAAAGNSMDFDLDLGSPAASTPAAPAFAAEPAAAAPMDFDFDLGSLPAVEAAPAAPALDLSAISLDLGAPEPSSPASVSVFEAPAAEASLAPEGDDAETATKLELAFAYEEMGDKEGARELLQEVLSEGSPAQQDAARQKLASLEA